MKNGTALFAEVGTKRKNKIGTHNLKVELSQICIFMQVQKCLASLFVRLFQFYLLIQSKKLNLEALFVLISRQKVN
jgi:hypothetical protein